MDIVKTAPPRPFHRRHWLPLTGAAFLVLAFLALRKFQGVSFIVFRDELVTAAVEQGELVVSIAAYGQLEPRGVYWVGAETEGMVEEIFASPGDQVRKGEVLLRLANPQLVRQLRDAELDFDADRAEHQAAGIEQDAQLLAMETDIASAELDWQLAKKDYDAKQELLSRAGQIISALELNRAELLTRQYRQRWEKLLQQYDKLKEAKAARLHLQAVRLRQRENGLQDLRDQVARLQVRALSDGTVQLLDVDLGQRVLPGQLITRIANADQLVASVNVPELQVNAIEVGMPATVNTRASTIAGRVLRIDPAASAGTVRVELALLDALPVEARPELNIEASIEIARLADALYVKRPVGAREFSDGELFKIETSGDFARRVPVRFGHLSSRAVEVTAGLSEGDVVIVSDTLDLQSHERVWLK